MLHVQALKMTFATQGFELVDNMLSAAELALARELAAGLIERHRAGDRAVAAAGVSVVAVTSQHPQRNPGVPAGRYGQEPYLIGDLLSLDIRFARIFAAKALWRWTGKFLGCATDEVVFHFSNLTRKPPLNGPAVGWHRDADNTYFASADRRTLRFLLPLQAMSAINGGTEILPGSHLPDAMQARKDDCASFCPTVAPGSCLALHSGVLHGGAPNRSTRERDVMVVQFGVSTSELRHRASELLSLSGRDAFVELDRQVGSLPNADGSPGGLRA